MRKINLIIADDHDLFRSGLMELLKKQKQLEVVGEAKDGQQFLDMLDDHQHIDIVLIDISMPQLNGFEVLASLSERHPTVRSIVISMHDDGNYIAKCARLGASGYLLKNADEEELFKAIEIVSSGSKYFSAEITEKMVNFLHKQETNQSKISKKETEVLFLLAKGLTTKEIAAKLHISTRTVETHRANLLKKQEVKNTAELIRKASKNKLI